MDTGEGRFEMFEDNIPEEVDELRKKFPKSKGVFTVGEEIEIKNSLFKVTDISPFGIKLRLLCRPENSADKVKPEFQCLNCGRLLFRFGVAKHSCC